MLNTATPQGAAADRRNLTPRQMEAQVFSTVARRLRDCGVHRIALRTDAPVIEPFLAFFRDRRAGRRAGS